MRDAAREVWGLAPPWNEATPEIYIYFIYLFLRRIVFPVLEIRFFPEGHSSVPWVGAHCNLPQLPLSLNCCFDTVQGREMHAWATHNGLLKKLLLFALFQQTEDSVLQAQNWKGGISVSHYKKHLQVDELQNENLFFSLRRKSFKSPFSLLVLSWNHSCSPFLTDWFGKWLFFKQQQQTTTKKTTSIEENFNCSTLLSYEAFQMSFAVVI